MAQLMILTPTELSLIAECSLQYHFWQQSPPDETDNELLGTVLKTIRFLHAAGGPHRINLPNTLRYMEGLISADTGAKPDLTARARQMIALYHRQLRSEWAQIIASNERLTLDIRLRSGIIRCDAVIHRLDQEEDGGVTVTKFIINQDTPSLSTGSVEATLLHALAAAAYPGKRPVRIKIRQLESGQSQTLQLSEKQYRQNIDQLQERVQSWLEGEILARPGLHCNLCPFKHDGCPIYENDATEENLADLPESDSPATLSARQWNFVEGGDDRVEKKTDS